MAAELRRARRWHGPDWTVDPRAAADARHAPVRCQGLRCDRRPHTPTVACQSAITMCTAAGTAPGEYSVGMLQLKDNVTLGVEAGATLFLIRGPPNSPAEGAARATRLRRERRQCGDHGARHVDGLAQYEFAPMRGVDPEITREIESHAPPASTCEDTTGSVCRPTCAPQQLPSRPPARHLDRRFAAVERPAERLRP